MKKILLSGSLIVIFVLYGLHQRKEGQSVAVTIPDNSTAGTVTTSPATSTPVPTDTPAPTDTASGSSPAPTPTSTPTPAGQYKNGSYTGSVADAYYGNIQVRARISGGKLVAVDFLQYPNDRDTSIRINSQAMPLLQQEAIQAQSANVDGVSGASDTSAAFIESLASALDQAKN